MHFILSITLITEKYACSGTNFVLDLIGILAIIECFLARLLFISLGVKSCVALVLDPLDFEMSVHLIDH